MTVVASFGMAGLRRAGTMPSISFLFVVFIPITPLLWPFPSFDSIRPGVKAALLPEAWEGGILSTIDDRGPNFPTFNS